jgi:hypothetical protein
MIQEIVPPKLNQDTGILSLLFNRRNFLLFFGVAGSLLIWTTSFLSSADYKIFGTIVLGFLLIPFLFDVHGRPLHIYLFDAIKYYFQGKKQRVILGRDISNGVIIISDNQFARVYRIEPINLSMSSSEEIIAFKQYVQSALFSLKKSIQILSVQKYSSQDESLATEIQRYQNLSGKLKDQCEQYVLEYQELRKTMERYFYIVFNTYARGIDDARRKLDEEENSFGRLLEQTKIKLIPLESSEILELTEYILPKSNNVSD